MNPEMPRYTSSRGEVYAVRITHIVTPGEEKDGSVLMVEPPYAPIPVNYAFMRGNLPSVGGYYLLRPDGEALFMGAQAFATEYSPL